MTKRVLCLGNELLADDALGAAVAARLRPVAPPDTDVIFSDESGLRLVDYLSDVSLLVVVDSITTGQHPPGTVRTLTEQDCCAPPGGSPHYVGLFEVVNLARALRLPVPERVLIVAVEVSDTLTIGGGLTPAVEACIPAVMREVLRLLWLPGGSGPSGMTP